jgi:hypothetical protein
VTSRPGTGMLVTFFTVCEIWRKKWFSSWKKTGCVFESIRRVSKDLSTIVDDLIFQPSDVALRSNRTRLNFGHSH